MFKDKKMLFDFKEEIKNKYGYTEELAEDIALTAESCINYMGQDYTNIILEAINSCKYSMAKKGYNDDGTYFIENVYDVAKRDNMLDESENDIVSEGDLKRASGVYIYITRLTYQNNEYKIDRVDRSIIIGSSFAPGTANYYSALAHETMHLIKAYSREHTIENNQLRTRFGLGYADYNLSQKDGKVVKTKTKEIGVGIEEGINTYDELCLMRQFYDSNYEVYGYANLRIVGGFLMDNIGLAPQIRLAQVTGNTDEIRNIIDANMGIGYEEYLKRLDESVALEYERFAEILDPEKCDEVLGRLNKHFEEQIAPATRELRSRINHEMETGYGTKSA
jgi:hypothetical protein